MAMRWNATLDPDYARKVYPYLREVAAFWEDDLVWEPAPYEVGWKQPPRSQPRAEP
jgi:hypothetical protein